MLQDRIHQLEAAAASEESARRRQGGEAASPVPVAALEGLERINEALRRENAGLLAQMSSKDEGVRQTVAVVELAVAAGWAAAALVGEVRAAEEWAVAVTAGSRAVEGEAMA